MPVPPTQTSTTLLGRIAQGGDEEAARVFVRHYSPMVRACGRVAGLKNADIEDVVQEVMVAAIDSLRRERYDRHRGRFKAWLKGVIFHKIQKSRASQSRIVRASFGDDEDTGTKRAQPKGNATRFGDVRQLADPRPSPVEQLESEFEAQWRQVAYEGAIDEIRREVDPATFQAFDLYVQKNRPVREVAQLLGLTRNAVYIARSRILARLREKLRSTSC